VSPSPFAPDPGPAGPDYGTACPFPGCPSVGFSREGSPGVFCVLHHPREWEAIPPDIARLIGPMNQAARSEERGSR
jgi:hypothetical protein